MWDEAAASDEASWNASVAWVKRTGRTSDQRDFHSLSWLHYEYLQQGRFAKARELEAVVRSAVEQSARTSGPASSNAHHVESEIGRGYGPMSLRNELASMRARDIVESRDWSRMKGQGNFDNIDELFALGLAGILLGDPGRTQAAIERLQTAGVKLPDRDAADVSRIMASELTGVLQFAQGNRERGLAELRRASGLEASRPRPIARPYPIKPAIELYGELLLASGDARAAMRQFSASLTRTPRRSASLYGLASAAGVAGDAAEASKAAKEFLSVWRLADSARPELKDMRELTAAR